MKQAQRCCGPFAKSIKCASEPGMSRVGVAFLARTARPASVKAPRPQPCGHVGSPTVCTNGYDSIDEVFVDITEEANALAKVASEASLQAAVKASHVVGSARKTAAHLASEGSTPCHRADGAIHARHLPGPLGSSPPLLLPRVRTVALLKALHGI